MKEFQWTSRSFSGHLFFAYDEEGTLTKFENNAVMKEEHLVFFMKNFPLTEDLLLGFRSKNGKIEEVVNVTFERFWEAYGKKVNKKRTEQLWYKLSESVRMQCIGSLKRYKIYCKLNKRFLKDPDTYLRNESWNDEY